MVINRRQLLASGLANAVSLSALQAQDERPGQGRSGMPASWSGMSVVQLPAREPSPFSVAQLHSGHSLTDTYHGQPWPGLYPLALIGQVGWEGFKSEKSTVPGSTMEGRWQAPAGYGQPDARQDIADWELLVITEGNNDAIQWDGSWLGTWARHAWELGNSGSGAPTLLYTHWSDTSYANGDPEASPPNFNPEWREQLDKDEQGWTAKVDEVNSSLTGGCPPVYVIPGNRIVARLYDDILQDRQPSGIESMNDYFIDDVHPNGVGSYAIVCAMLLVVHHFDPRGLPSNLSQPGYTVEGSPSRVQAAYLQRVAWDVVTQY